MSGLKLVLVAGVFAISLSLPRPTDSTNETSLDRAPVSGETSEREKVPEALGKVPEALGMIVRGALLTKRFENDEKYFTGSGVTTVTPTLTPAGEGAGWSVRRVATSGGGKEETTGTTMTPPVTCNVSVIEIEGLIESVEYSSSPFYAALDCSYIITVYSGYGVEIQVELLNLHPGETLTVEDVRAQEPLILANEATMTSDQTIRSPSRQVLVHFQSSRSEDPGVFKFLCREYPLSCLPPGKPAYGEVDVTDLYPGGEATFRCDPDFQMSGSPIIQCLNSSHPEWSGEGATCQAICRATIHNATVGRILSPSPGPAHSSNLTCHWLIQAPPLHRLHLHFERLSLDEDTDRVIIRTGVTPGSPVLFHSDLDDIPEGGITSDSRELFVELVSENSAVPPILALHYEAFERGRCFEPFIPDGTFTTSGPEFEIGTLVRFSCRPGYRLEGDAEDIECIEPRDPHWNNSEPVCRAMCGGDVREVSGVIFSPAGSEVCVWNLHVRDDHRIALDVEILNMHRNDVLSIFNGPDLNSRVLGQYTGRRERSTLFSTAGQATVHFQSDSGPKSPRQETRGFTIHFREILRNDTCPPLATLPHGRASLSHSNLIRGTVATFQCEVGFRVVGPEIVTCQWDLSWSSPPPHCTRELSCPDPGEIVHGDRQIWGLGFGVGARISYSCHDGHRISGSETLRCLDRSPRTPKWSNSPPQCVLVHGPCSNPGAPDNAYLSLYKEEYNPGENIRIFCYDGFDLIGETSIVCEMGGWSSALPFCKVTYEGEFDGHTLHVSRARGPGAGVGGNVILAVLLPVALILVILVSGIILCWNKIQGKSLFRVPVTSSHPYSPLTVEADFNNPLFEAGETCEYEVSI